MESRECTHTHTLSFSGPTPEACNCNSCSVENCLLFVSLHLLQLISAYLAFLVAQAFELTP